MTTGVGSDIIHVFYNGNNSTDTTMIPPVISNAEYTANLHSLNIGMTQDEVVAALGASYTVVDSAIVRSIYSIPNSRQTFDFQKIYGIPNNV